MIFLSQSTTMAQAATAEAAPATSAASCDEIAKRRRTARMNPLVTIIIPTIGTPCFRQALESALAQTYAPIQVLLVTDGCDVALGSQAMPDNLDVLRLPYNTGAGGYNGHRIYGAASYLAKGDYLCFLDEDNWFDADHAASLMAVIRQGSAWAFSLRKIVDQDGSYICNDDCESLGNWDSCLGDRFVDVGCYFLPRPVAVALSPAWYRRARHPGEQPEVDRLLAHLLRQQNLPGNTSGRYTLNYRAGHTERSVKKEFFLQGNARMAEKYGGRFPWRK